jgi:tetratricopeptide (TPR) repeat protein
MFRRLLLTAACMLVLFVRAGYGADASALFAEAEQAFAAGQYDEALRLFKAAREAGSTGPSSYYNIGVSEYLLRDYAAAEATFATLAAEYPAMRELAEYNRGLALRAAGTLTEARTAFARASASADAKIAALANAQLRALGVVVPADAPRWQGYFSADLGYDDNVALVDELVLTADQSASSPFVDALGVLSRDFGAVPLRFDATGYWVRYADADQFDQSAIRLALAAEQRIGAWALAVGPVIGRSVLDGDGFEDIVGADLRLRRSFSDRLSFETRIAYDDVEAGDARFTYLEGSRRQLRLAVQHTGAVRVRVGYDVERNNRADPGVSPSRQRWSVLVRRELAGDWTADALLSYRESRYREASVPREERLVEMSLAARRDLRMGWTLIAEYRWSDNDSTVPAFSYGGRRLTLGLGRGF